MLIIIQYIKGFPLLIHISLLLYSSMIVIIGLKSQYLWTFLLADTAEVIQSRLNEQEGREEFYVHYVGCEYVTHYRCARDPNSPPASPSHRATICRPFYSQQTPG